MIREKHGKNSKPLYIIIYSLVLCQEIGQNKMRFFDKAFPFF